MQRAVDSAIGLPRRSTSASWMLGFLMPADVRRSRILPPAGRWCRRERLGAPAVVTGRPARTHRLRPDSGSRRLPADRAATRVDSALGDALTPAAQVDADGIAG